LRIANHCYLNYRFDYDCYAWSLSSADGS
jgi:hypothetical protein